MPQLNPYLNFDGDTREAMNFYASCLDGELQLQTVGESPMAAQMPPQSRDLILHSSVTAGSVIIMASDMNRGNLLSGNMYSLCLNFAKGENIDRYFSKLADGGKINDPLEVMPWGAKFGSVTDKFGIQWLFNGEL